MNILLTGATGFIGNNLARIFYLAGHRLRCAVRNRQRAQAQLPVCELVEIDFSKQKSAEAWLPLLQGIDVVVNAAGIFEQKNNQTFSLVHTEVPCALFEACALASIKRVVQISALGAKLDADTEFLRSKARADNFLFQQNVQSLVLQPSLVFGEGSASSELFMRLAMLPVMILPDGGNPYIQPVHIDDLTIAVMSYIENEGIEDENIDKRPSTTHYRALRVAAVGANVLSVRDYIQTLRQANSHVIGISSETLAKISRVMPVSWISADALSMLQRGSCADPHGFAALLNRAPLAPEDFAPTARKIRNSLILRDGFLVLRYSIALLWIATGIISLGIYPIESSKLLLARVGIPSLWQEPLLYMAAALDVLLGLATLFARRLRILWWTQLFTIFFYSAIIAWKLPEFWLHPYAPMLKNIPLLAAIYLMMRWENARVCHR